MDISVPLIPREVLFGNPERTYPQLSPDGKHLAWLAPDEGVMNVWVSRVGADDARAITRDRDRGIQGYAWAPNSNQVLYIQDKDGDENWHVYSVPAEGGDARDLTPIDGVQANILRLDRGHPDEMLVGLNDRVPQLHDVYRIDLRTGERTLEVQNDIGAVGWSTDHDLHVRVAMVPTPTGGFSLHHRTGPGAEWKQFLDIEPEDSLSTRAVAFAADNQTLYMVNSIGANTGQVRTYSLETGEEKLIASDPEADVSDLLLHPTEYRLQAAAFMREREDWQVLDPSIEADFEALRQAHHGDFVVIGRDNADATWLVAYAQDLGPTLYYSYDRGTKQSSFLFSTKPVLEEHTLAAMKPVSYPARDGLTIHGYLTLPPGAAPENLPTVIDVHGGPWHRDTWGFDAEAQWLANRGYACLQVNFRGSTGYGKDFLNAGDREWGGRMQHDISDGVQWLIDQGIADPARVAIYGGSYGGFAVLSGMTSTPDLYACGVDIVGPSNLLTFIDTIPPYWEPLKRMFTRRVGDPEQDREFLLERSPLEHVDKITAPLFIAQGANDPRVKREESLQIVDALEKKGKTIRYMEFADEGHGFARPENRLKFYSAAEEFLATHLGGRCEGEH